MEPTPDMQAILNFLKLPEVTGSVQEIAFCTRIPESSVEIDLDDMAAEGWISLSMDTETDDTVAKIA